MKKVEVDDREVTPLEQVAPGVAGLKIAFVNVYGISHSSGSWTLVDAGLPFSAGRIHSWAKDTFGGPPASLILTHGHFDHVGSAKELADEWDIPIYAHIKERPYLTGDREYPAPNWRAGGGVMPFLSVVLPTKPVDLGDRLNSLIAPREGAELAVLPGWTLLETPGHTPGHISLFREEDRTLIVGDAFCTTPAESFFAANFTQPPELHGPPKYFTSDWQAARHSVDLLGRLKPAAVAPGHGRPLSGSEVAVALSLLAQQFDSIAVPENVK